MAQYTNPYGQQYYSATPYAPNAHPTAPSYSSQYVNPQASQYNNFASQYAQYQNAYQVQQTQYQPQIQPYSGYSQHPIPRLSAAQGEGSNSVWMGDIEPWMDENFIYSLFAHTGEVLNVKLIRDKQTGMPSNYCFVYFATQLAAQKVIENFNGQPIPGTSKVFRLNFAQYGMGDKGGKRPPAPEVRPSGVKPVLPRPSGDEVISLFIGDLAPDVTDYYILTTFQYYYPSVYSAKVVNDPKTGLSKGYGFVYFTDENEKIRALNEMQGYYLSYRPIRLNLATKKGENKPPQYVPGAMQPNYPSTTQPPYSTTSLSNTQAQGPSPRPQQQQENTALGPSDSHNTTVFVGGIDPSVTHEVLKSFFQQYGEISQVKIPFGKGCAFIEFVTHESAGRVLNTLNGTAIIGNSQVRLSWGRPARSVPQPHQGSLAPGLGQQPPARPQITSQTSLNAAALLSQQISKPNQGSEKEEAQEEFSDGAYSEQGYQQEYGDEYQYADEFAQGEGRLVTNEDVNQAPSLEEQVASESTKEEEEGKSSTPSDKEGGEKKSNGKRTFDSLEASGESEDSAVKDPAPSTNEDEEGETRVEEPEQEETNEEEKASTEDDENEEQQPLKKQKTGETQSE